MSDTPKTDEAALHYALGGTVSADFARELERQNANLRNALELILIGYEGLGSDTGNNAPRIAREALANSL